LRTLGAAPTTVAFNASAPYLGTAIVGAVGATFTSGTSAATLNITTTGTYLFTFSIAINNVISSGIGILVGTNTPAVNNSTFPASNLGQATSFVVGSAVVPQATGNYYLNISANIGGTLTAGPNFSFFQATRIG
jgi:hypothetical protein